MRLCILHKFDLILQKPPQALLFVKYQLSKLSEVLRRYTFKNPEKILQLSWKNHLIHEKHKKHENFQKDTISSPSPKG